MGAHEEAVDRKEGFIWEGAMEAVEEEDYSALAWMNSELEKDLAMELSVVEFTF